MWPARSGARPRPHLHLCIIFTPRPRKRYRASHEPVRSLISDRACSSSFNSVFNPRRQKHYELEPSRLNFLSASIASLSTSREKTITLSGLCNAVRRTNFNSHLESNSAKRQEISHSSNHATNKTRTLPPHQSHRS